MDWEALEFYKKLGYQIYKGKQTLIKPGIYEHCKGQRYRVLGIAQHTETSETFIVYQALYGDCVLWVRPISLFNATVLQDGHVCCCLSCLLKEGN